HGAQDGGGFTFRFSRLSEKLGGQGSEECRRRAVSRGVGQPENPALCPDRSPAKNIATDLNDGLIEALDRPAGPWWRSRRNQSALGGSSGVQIGLLRGAPPAQLLILPAHFLGQGTQAKLCLDAGGENFAADRFGHEVVCSGLQTTDFFLFPGVCR